MAENEKPKTDLDQLFCDVERLQEDLDRIAADTSWKTWADEFEEVMTRILSAPGREAELAGFLANLARIKAQDELEGAEDE